MKELNAWQLGNGIRVEIAENGWVYLDSLNTGARVVLEPSDWVDLVTLLAPRVADAVAAKPRAA